MVRDFFFDRKQRGTMAKRPRTGERAPDFELEGTDGSFRLSDHQGRRVVLLFYPADDSPVCTRQFCSYRDRSEEFAALDAVSVGISSQDLDSHRAFQEKHGLDVPLLADHGGTVAKMYDAHAPVIGTRRAVVIVGEDGVVQYRHDHTLGLAFQDVDDIRAALASTSSGAA